MCEGDNLSVPVLDTEAVFDRWRDLPDDIRVPEETINEEIAKVLAYREESLSLPVLEGVKYAVQAVINRALLDNEMDCMSRHALEEELTLACKMLRIPLSHDAEDTTEIPPMEEFLFFRNLLNPPYQSIRDSGDL